MAGFFKELLPLFQGNPFEILFLLCLEDVEVLGRLLVHFLKVFGQPENINNGIGKPNHDQSFKGKMVWKGEQYYFECPIDKVDPRSQDRHHSGRGFLVRDVMPQRASQNKLNVARKPNQLDGQNDPEMPRNLIDVEFQKKEKPKWDNRLFPNEFSLPNWFQLTKGVSWNGYSECLELVELSQLRDVMSWLDESCKKGRQNQKWNQCWSHFRDHFFFDSLKHPMKKNSEKRKGKWLQCWSTPKWRALRMSYCQDDWRHRRRYIFSCLGSGPFWEGFWWFPRRKKTPFRLGSGQKRRKEQWKTWGSAWRWWSRIPFGKKQRAHPCFQVPESLRACCCWQEWKGTQWRSPQQFEPWTRQWLHISCQLQEKKKKPSCPKPRPGQPSQR